MQQKDNSLGMGKTRSRKSIMWRTFTRNKTAVIGVAMIIIIALISIFADNWFIASFKGEETKPLIAPFNPYLQDTYNRLQKPNSVHLLGLDEYGRDVLSRIIHGGRVSLIIGISAALLGGILGSSMGIIAGYMGKRVENIIMRGVDILMAFPSLLMGLMLVAALHRLPISGMIKTIIAIGITSSSSFARLAHSTTLSVKENVYIEAARSSGAGGFRIIGLHITPNILGDLIVMMSLQIAQAIRVEASLSFIGLGVSPPVATWGNMIRDGMRHITYAPFLSVYPGLAILLTVLAFNFVGDALRDITDPYLRT